MDNYTNLHMCTYINTYRTSTNAICVSNKPTSKHLTHVHIYKYTPNRYVIRISREPASTVYLAYNPYLSKQ
ncbi:hypothetical protein CICLE_v10026898mg [Citrus x clementina]|uniref:Uncharacterized protein n=1 Tax=Citrus clementina TaxID=85681 RepID=V4SKI5_CITCL|nr:hypothetical protein CICLE_v10026898mg [Citrus x clementina]